ncbi:MULTISPECIES: hypothetical protein [Priestia]|uniref:FAD/NAD(P)-binding domain-containing protein n=1 Tax=Priestia megaterium (strain ATCC 12872 / QMB1551) TaxID=545693 RepID=D5E4H7_PRIM1|nr:MULTISPECIES: hypothetical protein [Priestia]ADE72702.1 conserved hypothetical protein [Priestia megaterium QM B1551]
MERQVYNLAICGCGPAGISPLVYLEENKLLEKYLDEGICLIDEKENIGAGKLINYNITANSLGKVFLEIFQKENSSLYKHLMSKESYKNISSKLESAPYLKEVGNLLQDIGSYFIDKIRDRNNGEVYNNHKILEVKRNKKNIFEIKLQSFDNKFKTILARHVIFNIGGKQNELFEKEKTVIYSDDFISGLHDDFVNEFSNSENKTVISIVGSSHSAFSSLYRLKNNFNFLNRNNIKIQVFNRSNIKLFYNSVEEAINDNYQFNMDQDVCYLSNRVNRYSGLRYDSFILAKECMSHKYKNVEIKNKEFTESDFLDSSLVICATGYTNKSVEILDSNHEEIIFQLEQGQLLTDHYCRPYIHNSNNVFEKFYTYGLGSGIKTNPKNGGELNYTGRIDGVWVYQHEVSKRIVEDISYSIQAENKVNI